MSSTSQKKRRRRKRRRGPGILLILIAAIIIIASIIAAITIFFKIRVIEVSGETRYEESYIIEAAQIEKGGNMFVFNKFSAISRIFSACPYLDEISIRRRLPDTVEILVTEHTPVASIHDGNYWYLISADGKILEKSGWNAAEGYCMVTGLKLKTAEVGKYAVFSDEDKRKPFFTVLNTAINSDILNDIGEINIERFFEIEFTYQDRFLVKIGTSEELDYKIRILDSVIEKLSPNESGVIDVSSAPVARFRADDD